MSIRVFVMIEDKPGAVYPCTLTEPTEGTMGLPQCACGKAVVGLWCGAKCGECDAAVVGVSCSTREEAAQIERWIHKGMRLILAAELRVEAQLRRESEPSVHDPKRGEEAKRRVSAQVTKLFDRLNAQKGAA